MNDPPAAQPNNGMHPTRISVPLMQEFRYSRVCGRVMPGVRPHRATCRKANV
jgi:hypothetical protein